MEGSWLLYDKTGVFYPVLRQNWSRAASAILSGDWGGGGGSKRVGV